MSALPEDLSLTEESSARDFPSPHEEERENLLGRDVDTVESGLGGLDQRSGLQQQIGELLESSGFWMTVMLLILVDLAMFTWQVIYSDDPRLHVAEVIISALFVLELVLRLYAFQIQTLLSCVQIFDTCVVLVSFCLSVSAIKSPILAARSARVLLLLRGGSRITRALAKTSLEADAARRSVEMRTVPSRSNIAAEAVEPLRVRVTELLASALDEALERRSLSREHKDLLTRSRVTSNEGAADAVQPVQDEIAIEALKAVFANPDLQRDTDSPSLRSSLRGSRLSFPGSKL